MEGRKIVFLESVLGIIRANEKEKIVALAI